MFSSLLGWYSHILSVSDVPMDPIISYNHLGVRAPLAMPLHVLSNECGIVVLPLGIRYIPIFKPDWISEIIDTFNWMLMLIHARSVFTKGLRKKRHFKTIDKLWLHPVITYQSANRHTGLIEW